MVSHKAESIRGWGVSYLDQASTAFVFSMIFLMI